jgi:hypothetical protein
MTDKRWVPLSARGKAEERFEVLYEGVPAHLLASVWDWLESIFVDTTMNGTLLRGYWPRVDLLHQFERYSRKPLNWGKRSDEAWQILARECKASENLLLDVVDFALSFGLRDAREASTLEELLLEAGSAWTVVPFDPESPHGLSFKLERRVSEPVATAVRETMNASGRAGQHLAKAWGLVYGRNPDPDGAYLEAVKAVEAAMVPVISPNNTKATLGTMLGDMKGNADKFVVEMLPIDNTVDSFEVVRSSCQMLWKAQPDRHGTPEARAHSHVSQKAAEGAVQLAVTLVQWFVSGVVRRK